MLGFDSKVVPMIATPSENHLFAKDDTAFEGIISNKEVTDVQQQHWTELLRIEVKKLLSTTFAGKLYSDILLTFSILSPVQFIYQTYLTLGTSSDIVQLSYFHVIEKSLAVLFMFDWLLMFLLADHKLTHVMSFFSMVDLLTVIPIWVTQSTACPNYSQIYTLQQAIVYVVCGLSTTRILRALRIRRKLIAIEDEVQRCLGEISLVISVMILFNSAVMQYLESEVQPLPFHTWMYYIWVTLATVGYGDITPKSILGRFAAMSIIAFAIINIPKMTNELIAKMGQQSIYCRLYYIPKNRHSQHVLICGDLNSCPLAEFFGELFHEDHENDNLHAVVLQPESPDHEMLAILHHPIYSLCVTFLEGYALSDRDLKRAHAHNATAVFIMTNKFSVNPDEEDSKTILQQFSIQRYMAVNPRNRAMYCLQLIRPENKRHLVKTNTHQTAGMEGEADTSTDLVVCLNEIKLGVIAKAITYPGTNTLIMNLLSSFADDDADDEAVGESEIENLDEDIAGNWLGEYQRGCDWEIYTTELADIFCGAKFSSLSSLLYDRMGIVLIGLEIQDLKAKDNFSSQSRMLLNPGEFVIPPKEDCRVQAFVMAKNKAQSDLTFSNDNVDENFLASSGMQLSQLSLFAQGLTSKFSVPSSVNGSSQVEHADATANNSGGNQLAWQKLLRKFESEKKASDSQQELLQIEEDQYLRSNYYIRKTPSDITDAFINTSVTEEIPYIDGHLIIIGKAINSLYDLIRPLRARYLGSLKYIVILYPDIIPHAVWQRINIFEGILIVRGSGLEESDIRRAGIFRASSVIVLADCMTERKTVTSGAAALEALVDADAIFSYQCVRRLNELAHCVIEIVHDTNVGYLDHEAISGDLNYKFAPQFASGMLFTSSLLDTLVCQAYYNQKIILVLNQLISGPDHKEKNNVTKANGSTRKGVYALTGSSLYQISVPENLSSRTYGALFKYLAKQNIIPLGLLRGVFPHMKVGPKANRLPYVFTNPAKDAELFTCDKVFVLSQQPLYGSFAKQQLTTELSNEILMYEHLRNRRNLVEDTASNVVTLRDHVKSLDEHQTELSNQMKNLASDVTQKMDSLMKAMQDLQHNNQHHSSNNFQSPSPQMPRRASVLTTPAQAAAGGMTSPPPTRTFDKNQVKAGNNNNNNNNNNNHDDDDDESESHAKVVKLDGFGGYRAPNNLLSPNNAKDPKTRRRSHSLGPRL